MANPLSGQEVVAMLKAGKADEALLAAADAPALLALRPLHALVSVPPVVRTEEYVKTMGAHLLRLFGAEKLLEQQSEGVLTPLLAACRYGDVVAARCFLDWGADPNGVSDYKPKTTPLVAAGRSQATPEFIELLIARGADPNRPHCGKLPLVAVIQKTYNNNSPNAAMNHATWRSLMKHTHVTGLLMKELFTLATQALYPALLVFLLSCDDALKSFDPPLSQNKDDGNPLVQLIVDRKPAEWFQLLLENKHKFARPIDLDALDALALAIKHRPSGLSPQVIELLIKHGADVNRPTSTTSELPFLLACQHSPPDVTLLLQAGADVHSVDMHGQSALHAAMLGSSHELCARLIQEFKLDPWARDVAGNSAFAYGLVYKTWQVEHLLDLFPDGEQQQQTERLASERINWAFPRPVTPAMNAYLDARKAKHQARVAETTPQDVDQLKFALNIADDEDWDEVELVVHDDDDTWSRKHDLYTKRHLALGHRFARLRGTSALSLIIRDTARSLFKRVVAARPDLLVRSDSLGGFGVRRKQVTPLEEAAKRLRNDEDPWFLQRGLHHLHAHGVEIPSAVRQRVVWKLFDKAEYQRWFEMLQFLPMLGADKASINQVHPVHGYTLLHKALSFENPSKKGLVSALILAGADLEARDKEGNTPLLCCPDAESATVLLAAGARVDVCRSENGQQHQQQQPALVFLHNMRPKLALTAIQSPSAGPDLIHPLVVRGMWNVATALMDKWVVQGRLREYLQRPGHKSPVWALVVSTVPASERKEDKWAEQEKNFLSLFRLVTRGWAYDPGRSPTGESVLEHMVKSRRTHLSKAAMKLVLDSCATTYLLAPLGNDSMLQEREDDGDNAGESCLALAVRTGYTPLLEALCHRLARTRDKTRDWLPELRSKLDVMREAQDAPSFLMRAIRPYAFASRSNLRLVKALFTLGLADVQRAVDAQTGNPVLSYAVITDSIPLVEKLIIDAGADVNQQNHAGETPLFFAVRHNLWHMTLHLLLRGADPHATNKAGECVLAAAWPLCAAVIYDFVVRPRSLFLLATKLAGAGDLLLAQQLTNTNNSSSSSRSSALTSPDSGTEPMHVDEPEPTVPGLSEAFPELMSPAATSTEEDSELGAVQRVTQLLENVLAALQLYRGAPSETDEQLHQPQRRVPTTRTKGAKRAAATSEEEEESFLPWTRNESLEELKRQLTGWLRDNRARFPRIAHGLSFSTLSEAETRKRKRIEGPQDDEDEAEPHHETLAGHLINVKRPRLGDDGLPLEPPSMLHVPDWEAIPLPPPFLSRRDDDDADDNTSEASWKRSLALVSDQARPQVLAAIERFLFPAAAAAGKLPVERWELAGLMSDSAGYLLDAFLSRLLLPASPFMPTPSMATTTTVRQLQAIAAVARDSLESRSIVVVYCVWETDKGARVFTRADEARTAFGSRFHELTGNAWAERQRLHPSFLLQASEPEPDAENKGEDNEANEVYLYLPTNHEALLAQRAESPAKSEKGTAALARILLKREEPADMRSSEQRLFDLWSFIASKLQIRIFCHQAGLDSWVTVGHLSAAQLRNAHKILDGLAGILRYEEALQQRRYGGGDDDDDDEGSRAQLPSHVARARADLSRLLHCLLPFNRQSTPDTTQTKKAKMTKSEARASASDAADNIIIDSREKLEQKADLLVSLQEIGIGLDVLHEVSLPPRFLARSAGGEGEMEEQQQQQQKLTSETFVEETKEKMIGLEKQQQQLQASSDEQTEQARLHLLRHTLPAKLTPLDKRSDEWRVIVEMMRHCQVVDAFAVEREGEAERYRPFANLPRRTLLVHGTGVANVMGILRKGLSLTPLGAKTAGTATLGKGLYFADAPNKSLQYSYTRWGDSCKLGCALLCEVALGEPFIRRGTGAQRLPPGRHHHLRRPGDQMAPDPELSLHTDDGVIIPLACQEEGNQTAAAELMVPNEGQVRIRYLLLLGCFIE